MTGIGSRLTVLILARIFKRELKNRLSPCCLTAYRVEPEVHDEAAIQFDPALAIEQGRRDDLRTLAGCRTINWWL